MKRFLWSLILFLFLYTPLLAQKALIYYDGIQRIEQFMFHKEWMALKEYANEKGISIIGDIPIYVSMDSADAWANPELFQLDENRRPTHVAGCPPDAFSEDGQLWGNPIYDWEKMKADGKTLELDENDNIKGWDDTLSGLKTQFPAQFDATTTRKVLEDGKLPQSEDYQTATTQEEFNKMGYSSRVKLKAENPELYSKLKG